MTKKTESKILEFKTNKVVATCITCNNKYEIISTLTKNFKIDVCSKCHSFYLGTQKFESKAGRMERFRKIEKKTIEIKNKIQKDIEKISFPNKKVIEIKKSTKKEIKKVGSKIKEKSSKIEDIRETK